MWIALNYNNGKFSHTKFWSNIAYTVATFMILRLSIIGGLTENYFLFYLTVVACHGTASKFLNLQEVKHGG